jgi:hypothetical protein
MLSVPAISRFFGIVIAMNFDDHDPPHFHARHADGEAKVQIDTLEVIEARWAGASFGSCSPGPNCTETNSRTTGVVHGRVRHCWRSSHCDDRPHP